MTNLLLFVHNSLMEPPGSCPLHLGPYLQTLPLGHRRKHFGQVTCVLVSSFFYTCKIFFKFFVFYLILSLTQDAPMGMQPRSLIQAQPGCNLESL